jgi:hypothetical protein
MSRWLAGLRDIFHYAIPKPERANLVAPVSWVRKIEAWRRQQDDFPNLSEAIRRLVEIGLRAKVK